MCRAPAYCGCVVLYNTCAVLYNTRNITPDDNSLQQDFHPRIHVTDICHHFINVSLSISHSQYDIINLTLSIWHYQYDIINLTLSIWQHQFDIIKMTFSIWHYQFDIIAPPAAGLSPPHPRDRLGLCEHHAGRQAVRRQRPDGAGNI